MLVDLILLLNSVIIDIIIYAICQSYDGSMIFTGKENKETLIDDIICIIIIIIYTIINYWIVIYRIIMTN